MTATVLYIDCQAGAAGDMLLAALIDAGAGEEPVRRALGELRVAGWSLEIHDVTRGGIRALRAVVTAHAPDEPRDHATIRTLLEGSRLPQAVKERALSTFEHLARAEAKVHGVSVDRVRFHEVGGVDAMVDIVGCAAAFEALRPSEVVTSAVPLGDGVARSTHGPLPVPAPAVLELLRGAPVHAGGTGETITPTGAAILRATTDRWGAAPRMVLTGAGYGAGARDTEGPNVVRVLVGETAGTTSGDEMVVLETNIDDMTPELLPNLIERALVAGAVDAWLTPITMKKGRPAVTFSVLVPPQEEPRVVDAIFRESSTFGIRRHAVTRALLPREWIEVYVEGHSMRVKVGRRGGDAITTSPEYEDAQRVSQATGLTLEDTYRRAIAAAMDQLRLRS